MALPLDMDPSKTPLALNPSGAPPNFVDPPSLLDIQTGVGAALIVIGGVLVTFRLATNFKLHRKLGLDDWLCVFAFGGGIGYWALSHVISTRGTSRHAWDVPISVMSVSMMQIQVAIQFLIAPTMWASKAAILALYIRVFGSVTWLRRTAYFWIVFMALFYGMNIVIAGVYCVPRKGEDWAGATFGRCTESAWLQILIGVFSCLADLFILILPFPILLRLHISMAKKCSLTFVFGTGLLLVALSGVSLYLRTKVFRGTDPTWNGAALQIVTVAEVFGTIAVSCAPAMSSFWLNIFTKSSIWTDLRFSFIFSSRRSQSSKENLAEHQRNDSAFIVKETSYKVSEDGVSSASSEKTVAIPLSTAGVQSR